MTGILRAKLTSWTEKAVTLMRRADNDEDSYSLRLFDDELLMFAMSNSGLSGLTARILVVNRQLGNISSSEKNISPRRS